MWLAFAAPARFFDVESASQVVVASRSHLVMKLLSAAPASFLSAASDLQVANAGAAEIRQTARANAIFFMAFLLGPSIDRTSRPDSSRNERLQKATFVGLVCPRDL